MSDEPSERCPRRTVVTLADYRPALRSLESTKSDYAIVGGLAVGRWAELYLKLEEEKRFAIPIRSKDIDLRASKDVAVIFLQNLQAQGAKVKSIVSRKAKDRDLAFPSVAAPVSFVSASDELETTVEVLSGLPLLDEWDGGLWGP